MISPGTTQQDNATAASLYIHRHTLLYKGEFVITADDAYLAIKLSGCSGTDPMICSGATQQDPVCAGIDHTFVPARTLINVV
jgi:hypothetical protein